MTSPRRAAEVSEVTTSEDVAPRHGRGGALSALRPFVRRTIPPLAIIGVVAATTVLTFVPMREASTSVADPMLQANVDLGVSRARTRAPLADVPTAGPSPTISPSSVPSPSVVPSTTPPIATASPTPPPDAVTPSPTPTPVVETPAPAPAPAVDHSALGDKAGTLYTTAGVNVRTGPGTGFDAFTSLAEGAAVTATETTADGWQQVSMSGKAGWIKAGYLTDEEPVREQKAATQSASSEQKESEASSGSGYGTSSCSKASGIEGGLTSNTVRVLRAICNAFPNVSSYGGYRSGGGSYHASGRAIDVMISGEAGWEIARWLRSNAGSLGVIEVIYAQQIWTAERSGDGWRGMSDRGSATANHYDHVHVSVR